MAADEFERFLRRRQQLQGCTLVERLRGSQPALLDHLGAVVNGDLRARRRRQEEAGVEALGTTLRGDPVAEVDQALDSQPQSEFRAQPGQGALAAMQRAAPRCQPCGLLGIGFDQPAARVVREQQPGFLETLPHGGHVVVEAAFGHTQSTARGKIVQISATAMSAAITRIDHTAREDPGAAVVVAALGAA